MILAWISRRFAWIAAGAVAIAAALGWLRHDAASDAEDALEKEIKDADEKRAREIRDAVAGARRGGGLLPDDDTRGFRD